MPKLPQIRSKELVSKLKAIGFAEFRQKGSHLILFNEEKNKMVVIPMHNKPLKKGTLGSILRHGDISIEDIL